jgi:hypothetical protein
MSKIEVLVFSTALALTSLACPSGEESNDSGDIAPVATPDAGGACAPSGGSCAPGKSCCAGLICCAGAMIPIGSEFCAEQCPVADHEAAVPRPAQRNRER